MIIYPAVDIKEGKCVRLCQGRFDRMTVYSDDPLEMAKKWKNMGASYIHVVDLDGARTGRQMNSDIAARIVEETCIPVQLGGGIRDLDAVESVLGKGISRVIIGTAAVKNPEFVKKAVELFGDRIVVGIDAKDGMVAIEGWERKSSLRAVEFAGDMEEKGLKTIIYTDISRDGMLTGPNLKAMEEMKKSVSIEIIASGGVGSLDDIKDLMEIGMPGVIVGKALYSGNVNLKEALLLCSRGE